MDSFARFVRSETWIQFLQTKDKDYLSKVSSPKVAISFDYKDSDFEQHIVTDTDIQFIEQLAEDSFVR
jgi:hypothetical protein